ncbi:hypothetical protein GGR92_004995 [Spirosoma lacussanchae]|uniref:DUF6577 family protein n=1 Tax=Spirosoma lacussanchae TaxID=1884249 RepID=UPI001FEC7D3E|nr:DUF6577 family protein [Spirosoma lacussanchae]
MSQETIHTALRKQFGKQEVIPKLALIDFLRKHAGEAKTSTLAWRLHELTQEGVLVRTGYGQYRLNDRPTYQPDLSPTLRKISDRVRAALPFTTCCVWDTRVLADFMIQQPISFLQLVEVEREAVSSVYQRLQEQPVRIDRKSPALYRYDDWLLLSQRGLPAATPVIVKPLLTEAPVQQQDGYVVASLEKILVDLLADDDLFFAYQEELPYIFQAAFAKFTINRDKLRRYARRRNRTEPVEQLLRQIPSYHTQP